MATITKEALLAKTGRRYKEFQFEGDTYRLQNMSGLERTNYELALQNKKSGKVEWEKARDMFIVRTLVDESNARLLQDEDLSALSAIDGKVLGMLYDIGTDHCGYKPGEIEELVKNSEPAAG